MTHPTNSTLTIAKPTEEILKANIINNQKDKDTNAKASWIARNILNVLQASPGMIHRLRFFPS